MGAAEMSSLFLFRDYIGKTTDTSLLKNSMKKEKINIYEKKLEEFLNTWMIFSCRNKNCCRYCNKDDIYLLKSNDNIIDYSFLQIFGDKYVNNTIKYIIKRLIRFRHILKDEPIKTFDQNYKDFTDSKKNIFRRVLSNKDPLDKLSTYKSIFRFYGSIHSMSNEMLMNKMDSLIKEISTSYLENDLLENKLLGFVEENIFYNNSLYSDLREQCLVIFFELVCRFYECINMSPYDTFIPTPQYVNNFYEIQKSVISNDILYIFLRDSKNILVYDLGNKITETTNLNYRVKKINDAHRIYLYSFDNQIMNMVYSEDNIILIMSDGTTYINGKNTNNKITKEKDNTIDIINFQNFDIVDAKNISYIKIYNDHIYLCENTNIYIIGNINEDYAFNSSNCVINDKYAVYNNIEERFFILSDDEKKVVFYESDDEIKKYVFNSFTISVNSNTLFTIEFDDPNKDTIEFNIDEEKEGSKISNIIKLRNDAFILELSKENKDESVSYFYYIFGNDEEDTFRLGFDSQYSDENKLNDISKYIQTGLTGEFSENITIKSVESFDNRTIILNSTGIIFAAGSNDGYFFSVETPTLVKFSPINSALSCEFKDIAATRNLSKPLVFGYSSKCAIGMGPLYYLGMKSGSTFRYTDEEVLKMNNEESNPIETHFSYYSYFCSGNCIYHLNPIYDLLAFNFINQINFHDTSISHVINSLNYLKDMSITYNEEAYEHMVENLTILGSEPEENMIMNKTLFLFSNLQNYAMHDSMILMYANDEEKYSCVSKFINMIGLMSENYSAMRTKRVKMGQESIESFKESLNDINFESKFSEEERLNGYRVNKNRCR